MVKKAVIPIAGLGTRFLALSKAVPKEFWPLVDKPTIQYIVEEAVDLGIKEIIFVISPEKKKVLDYFLDYFKKSSNLKKILKKRGKNHLLTELKNLEKISKNISFYQVSQKEPLGTSHAVLQAEKLIKNEPCAVLYGDDIVESKIPCVLQLEKIFRKYQKPVIALCQIPKESSPFYGMIEGKKISQGVYRIKKIVEKPSNLKETPSNLAVVGKHIITPEVFNHLKKTSFSQNTDISLSQSLSQMAEEGKEIYGFEFKGRWLECGNKLAYLKSNLYLCLKHTHFGKKLKKILKTI